MRYHRLSITWVKQNDLEVSKDEAVLKINENQKTQLISTCHSSAIKMTNFIQATQQKPLLKASFVESDTNARKNMAEKNQKTAFGAFWIRKRKH